MSSLVRVPNFGFLSYVSFSRGWWKSVGVMATLISSDRNKFNHIELGKFKPMEYSENKVMIQSGLFENEIGPGVLQSSIK